MSSLHHHLSALRVEKGHEFTHTSLGPPRGSFYVPSSSNKIFLREYEAAVERGEDLHLTERHRHVGPVVVDLDFRFKPTEPMEDPSNLLRRHTEFVEPIVRVYCEAMVNLVETPDKFEVYVTEKPGPRLDKGFLKDGIHLTVPQIVIRPSIQLMLREDVLGPLSAILGPLNLANQIEDVVDEAVIERNNWMMYGLSLIHI